jgi:hypothetical protein
MRRKCLELGADRVFDKSNEIDALIQYCAQLAGGQAGFGGDLLLGRRIVLSGQAVFDAVSGRNTRFDLRFGVGWGFGGRPR